MTGIIRKALRIGVYGLMGVGIHALLPEWPLWMLACLGIPVMYLADYAWLGEFAR